MTECHQPPQEKLQHACTLLPCFTLSYAEAQNSLEHERFPAFSERDHPVDGFGFTKDVVFFGVRNILATGSGYRFVFRAWYVLL